MEHGEEKQEREPGLGRERQGARPCRVLKSHGKSVLLYRDSALHLLRLCNPKE